MSVFRIRGAVLLMYIYVIMEHKIDNIQETLIQNANPVFYVYICICFFILGNVESWSTYC